MPRKPHRRASSGPTSAGSVSASAADSTRRDPEPRRAAAGTGGRAPEPDLLIKAAEDDPRVWGDNPDNRDSWLLEQRPPHWD